MTGSQRTDLSVHSRSGWRCSVWSLHTAREAHLQSRLVPSSESNLGNDRSQVRHIEITSKNPEVSADESFVMFETLRASRCHLDLGSRDTSCIRSSVCPRICMGYGQKPHSFVRDHCCCRGSCDVTIQVSHRAGHMGCFLLLRNRGKPGGAGWKRRITVALMCVFWGEDDCEGESVIRRVSVVIISCCRNSAMPLHRNHRPL